MGRSKNVRWDAYAAAYDLMATYNPAYLENMARFSAEIQGWQIAPGDILLDLGAGTGNYSIVLAKAFPHAQVWHVDSNPGMNAVAHEKAQEHRLTNLRILQEDVQRLYLAPRSIKAAVCINALYCMPHPWHLIHRIYQWIQPQGYFYVDDVGRVINLGDWFSFIFKSLYSRFGLVRSLVLIYKSRQVIAANLRIAKAQQCGEFWTHDLDQLIARFREAGFSIQHGFTGYRGYSDGLICRKPDLERSRISRSCLEF